MADAFLAPNARWQGRNQTGEPCINGKLYTYINMTTTPKATYKDYEEKEANTNPVELDSAGEANIYWDDAELYTIKLFDEDDNLIYTQDNYPIVGTNSVKVIQESEVNSVRNPQFFFWGFNNTNTFEDIAEAANPYDNFTNEWFHSHNATDTKITLSRQSFSLDQDEVPSNPTYFLRNQCTEVGTSTTNRVFQEYRTVRTYANQTVTVSFWAKSSTSSTLNVTIEQYFGSGGSPSASVETAVVEADLTTSWARYSGTVTLPDLEGKTIGTGNNDLLVLIFSCPVSELYTIDLTNVQFSPIAIDVDLPVSIVSSQLAQLNSVIQGCATTGDAKATLSVTPPAGWLACNDGTIGKPGSNSTVVGSSLKALYALIWTNVSATWAPIYTDAGVLSTRGASAEEDYNDLKQLALTRMIGRTIAMAGTPTFTSLFTADTTDLITVDTAIDDNLYTGTPVTFTTTGTLPAPLALATTYYLGRQGSLIFTVSTTLANAVAGVYIDIIDSGTGEHTVAISYLSSALGVTVGEQSHALVIAEVPSHDHPGSRTSIQASNSDSGSGAAPMVDGGSHVVTVAAQGGSGAHNNFQPTVFLNFMIKI